MSSVSAAGRPFLICLVTVVNVSGPDISLFTSFDLFVSSLWLNFAVSSPTRHSLRLRVASLFPSSGCFNRRCGILLVYVEPVIFFQLTLSAPLIGTIQCY
ncbi:uncharacterized protein EV420DRAFT_188779 [Desarmillaria tabescens]|uniref:Uncharacterized protein n=1 Tax=Armillaria tabescens TaxID=1929756 RepID=A0AA39TW01_ARMTA|nr:uncharacterized protein EV420DRAFT_188779 [Desarmillaria tabescens]KAK0461250.1 hypothetical protein EV420DRAFT_188779 [Desarmillaria tabescens]